jgi:hypothetical protein
VHFRKRIGVKGFNLIFKMSVALHGKQAQEATVWLDLVNIFLSKTTKE